MSCEPAAPDPIQPLRMAAIRGRLGQYVGSDQLIKIALDAVLAGIDSPSLAQLAGLGRNEEPEAHELFVLACDELSLAPTLPADLLAARWELIRWLELTNVTWHAFADWTSTGTRGSEGGTIALDEEHPDGARITLEQGGHTAPWAITCGVYGFMVRTRFFADRPTAEAEYEAMKPALHAIVSQLSAADLAEQGRLARDFVDRFPT
jgi:hypothetical protein